LRRYFLLCCLIWLGLSVWSALARPVIQVEASPRELKLGEPVRVTLTLVQEANGHAELIDSPNLALPPLDSFELLSQETSSATVGTAQSLKLTVQAVYILRPRAMGQLEIPSLTLQYRQQGQTHELVTEAVPIVVRGSWDTRWLPGLLTVLALGVVLGLTLGILKKRRQPQKQLAVPVSTLPVAPKPQKPVPVILSGLALFRQQLTEGVEPEQILNLLHSFFYQEAQTRGWLPAAGASTQEILTHLQTQIPNQVSEATLDKLAAFLKQSEHLRYAGQKPQKADLIRLLDLADQIMI